MPGGALEPALGGVRCSAIARRAGRGQPDRRGPSTPKLVSGRRMTGADFRSASRPIGVLNPILMFPLRLPYAPRNNLEAMSVHVSGDLRIDPGSIPAAGAGQDLEIVVPLTEWSVTLAVLGRVPVLTVGLNARVKLVAVHTAPYQAPFYCPSLVHAHLVQQVVELASQCDLPVEPLVVLARSREEGFQHVLTERSTVLLGARKHWWRTREESLARLLAREGYRVALLHVE